MDSSFQAHKKVTLLPLQTRRLACLGEEWEREKKNSRRERERERERDKKKEKNTKKKTQQRKNTLNKRGPGNKKDRI